MKQIFADLHCDTLLTCRQEKCSLENAPGHITLERLCRGGALLQCLAVFIPSHDSAAHYGIRDTAWDFFLQQADLFDREMKSFPDRIAQIRRMSDLEKNREKGLVSAMLTVEDGACLEGDMARLDILYERGVRMIGLTWNYENCIGYPNSADEQRHLQGLKDFGMELLERMGELGIAVDVSHLSEGGFWDVARRNRRPFAASHSCARALCGHSRNLTDRQLHALGDAGGICGVNFYSKFLRDNAGHTANDDILLHMEHIANCAGLDAVALGSDFDGIDCTLEMKDYSGLKHLAERIADRFGEDAADRICSGNALRFFSDVIG